MEYLYLIGGLILVHIILRVLIRKFENQFKKEMENEKLESDKMAMKYYKQKNDDLVGMANAIVYVNKEEAYVKQRLKGLYIYWLAKVLAYWWVP